MTNITVEQMRSLVSESEARKRHIRYQSHHAHDNPGARLLSRRSPPISAIGSSIRPVWASLRSAAVVAVVPLLEVVESARRWSPHRRAIRPARSGPGIPPCLPNVTCRSTSACRLWASL